jgi:hypothetical protein
MLDEPQVRELLGLADAETIAGFVDALASGDVVHGIALLDGLEERGRDLRGFLDQVVESLRETIVGAGREPAVARHPVSTLVAVARRLAAIDPSRAGVGGLRLQLEVALFPEPGPGLSHVAPPASTPSVPIARPARAAPATAQPNAPDEPDALEARSRAKRASKAVDSESPATPATAAAEPDTPAEPAPAAAPTDPMQTPPVEGDLALLRDRWPEIVARISAHPPTKPLIVACRPVSVEDGIVTLGFPEDQAFLRAVADRRRSVLEEGIGAVLGRRVAVRCIATNLDLVPEVSVDETEFLLREAQRIFGGDTADAAEVG